MKIILIGNLPEDRQESMQRFTALLHAGLLARAHDVTLLTPTLRLARFGPRYHYNGLPKYLGYFDKFVLFPRTLRRQVRSLQPDVVHFTDQASAIYRSSLHGTPVLTTCHDLLQIRAARGEIPQQALSRAAAAHQRWILSSLSRLPQIACVSEKTRADVLRLTGVSSEKISVVPNSLNYPYQPITPHQAHERLSGPAAPDRFDAALIALAPGGFLIQVGGEQWYKNRQGLLRIYAQLRRLLRHPPTLLMVGPPLGVADAALAAELNLGGHIVGLTGVSNSQLEALYNLAEGLIFPSWDEGFGWPIAEAQACGCPVFASNRSPMTEVGGRFATYFDPADPVAAAQAIACAWDERNTFRAPALAATARWQPSVMLDAYEARYRQLAA